MLDVQGENDFESSSSENAKIVSGHKNKFYQLDVPLLQDMSTRDIYFSEDAKSPFELFQKFFKDKFCGLLAEQTNICFMTKTGTASEVTNKFLGISIIMGNLNFRSLRMYWQYKHCVPIISETMTPSPISYKIFWSNSSFYLK